MHYWTGVFGALLLVASSVRADQVHLVEGRVLEGAATVVGDKVVIELESGRLTVPLREVAKIDWQAAPLDEATKRAVAVKASDVAGLMRVADFCREHDLPNKEREQLQRVLLVAPDHADARRRLGFVRMDVDGRAQWVDRSELTRRDEATRLAQREARIALEQRQAELSLAEVKLAEAKLAEQRSKRQSEQRAETTSQRDNMQVTSWFTPFVYGGGYYQPGAVRAPIVGPLPGPAASGPSFHINGVQHPSSGSSALPGVKMPAQYFEGAFRR